MQVTTQAIAIDTPAATRAAVRALPFTLPAVCPLCTHAIRDDERRGDYRGAPAHEACELRRELADVREETARLWKALRNVKADVHYLEAC